MPLQSTMPPHGFFNIDKTVGLSSFDVIRRLRSVLGTRHLGHTGTLDPFASGVLLIAFGPATRLIEYTHSLPKTYEVVLHLGATSTTEDVTGVITETVTTEVPSEDTIRALLPSFIGTHMQIPPIFSAIKQGGEPLYKKARRGEKVVPQARAITIHSITLLSYTYPSLALEVQCSTGTYIRSLGRDLGQALHCGAYAQSLRRTAIGSMTIQKAVAVEAITHETMSDLVIPTRDLIAHLPHVTVSSNNVAQLRQGRAIPFHGVPDHHSPIVLITQTGSLLGIGSYDHEKKSLLPQKILPA